MSRRAFWYHLKFELYDTPHPDAPPDSESKKRKKREFWVPSRDADIFESGNGWWPAHARREGDRKAWVGGAAAESGSTLLHTQTQIQTQELGEGKAGREAGQRQAKLIDCGTARPRDSQGERSSGDFERSGGAVLRAGEKAPRVQPQPETAERTAAIAARDWRFGAVTVEAVDMVAVDSDTSHSQDIYTYTNTRSQAEDMAAGSEAASGSVTSKRNLSPGINSGPRGQATKARFEEVGGLKNTRVGWGIVHLYRDGEETPGLGFAPKAETSTTVVATSSLGSTSASGSGAARGLNGSAERGDGDEEDTTVLCIPAVPSYMTPSDFLGWVGEKTREEVSHFRMVMTGQMNRYLVLLKFRDAAVARRWRAEWDGRVFGGLEPENCHVMFIKSIVFETPSKEATGSFPYMSLDPFTPNLSPAAEAEKEMAKKPFPPPTPALVELPTCPVCLERMDDTTGLLTILCQHVFHCACLTKWRGSGCPVCRHTQPSPSLTQPFGTTASDFCRVCDCSEDLWICLICGHVGCGRYKGGHAKEHWKETAHNYALEIETQHVWDYAGDLWVHRLIRDKGDGKVVELPSSSSANGQGLGGHGHREERDDVEMVPRTKLDNIGLEYTAMLTSQLESQRVYFEAVVAKAVDKASSASKAAELASSQATAALSQLSDLQLSHDKLRDEVMPQLERERDRLSSRADKSAELARSMTAKWQEEKKVGEGLLSRVNHLTEMVGKLRGEVGEKGKQIEELKDENRDLGFFISSSEKLKQVGGELGDEVREGTASVPEPPKGRGKGKGKGK